MFLAQTTVIVTSAITALAGLLGTVVGGWLTHRIAVSSRRYEETSRARGSLLRLASILVTESTDDDNAVAQAAEEAAAGVMALGYGSKTALTLLETTDQWRRFERGSFPRRRARDETLQVLDEMLERSLPPELRPKGLSAEWALRSGVRRPD